MGIAAAASLLVAAMAFPLAAPENLNPLLEPLLKKYDLPALAGSIVTSNGLVAAGAVGVRKYGTDTPVTLNDEFHLGSDTKAMTATLLAMLVEEGKLSWDTTLEQVFPELAPTMNPAYRKVTIEQMLAHRAGFTEDSWPKGMTFAEVHTIPGTPREQRAAYVAMVLREVPAYTPGSQFLYSNRSYAVGGVIAEKIANDSWENLMQKRIFDPLGMRTCGFGAMGTAGKIDQPWQHKLLLTFHRPIEPGPRADNPPAIGPAGTVHCSIVDWGKFVTAHLRGEKGEPGILKPETFKRLHTAPYGDYGFGWVPADRPWAGGRALNHNGSNTQNYAIVWMAPFKDFAVLVATNQGDTFDACDATAWALIQHFTQSK
ncbi:MAG TPA: serine hydrolase domain-containing protein [Candidatus Sulfotelmatobacter sp.]|nr:serine hydrolase domain-containing protein [Candidatus Sulfotelmatobacter sp.]